MPREPRVGDVVHFVVGSYPCDRVSGQHRAAIVVRAGESVNLRVLLDWCDTDTRQLDLFAVAVRHSDACEVGTWHWPEEGTQDDA